MAPWRAPTRPPRSAAARSNSEEDWRRALGRKVSLRYRLHDDPAHAFSEAIGVVMRVAGSSDDETVGIVKRTGQVVDIPARDIVAAKIIV